MISWLLDSRAEIENRRFMLCVNFILAHVDGGRQNLPILAATLFTPYTILCFRLSGGERKQLEQLVSALRSDLDG